MVLEATKSPRRKKEQEWSRGYRVLCMAIALLVGTSPLLLIGLYLGLSPADADSGGGSSSGSSSSSRSSVSSAGDGGTRGSGTSSASAANSGGSSGSSRACAAFPAANGVNGTLLSRSSGGSGGGGSGSGGGSVGSGGGGGDGGGSSSSGGGGEAVVALALVLDEGPRGEYRRRSREAIAASSTHALATGLRLYAFAPCTFAPGSLTLLAASSPAAACRLSRAVASHRCAPAGNPQACSSHAQGGGKGVPSRRAMSSVGVAAAAATAPSALPLACPASSASSSAKAAPPAANATASTAAAVAAEAQGVVIGGCCAPEPTNRGRKHKLPIGRGLHSRVGRGRIMRLRRALAGDRYM